MEPVKEYINAFGKYVDKVYMPKKIRSSFRPPVQGEPPAQRLFVQVLKAYGSGPCFFSSTKIISVKKEYLRFEKVGDVNGWLFDDFLVKGLIHFYT